jgi:hypothetical protein
MSLCHRVRCNRAAASLAAICAMLAATGARGGAAAEVPAGVPIMAACKPATPPVLPERWRAVGLLIPQQRVQIDVGDFVYDASLPAMRATVYGLESGAVDLLITDKQTYRLAGPHDAPTGCTALGPLYRPPDRHWLSQDAVCDGEAPVGPKQTQWWKMRTPEGRSKRQWYATDTRLPWRVMFPDRSSDPAVIGDYAITYFSTFTPLTETKLKRLRDYCVANARKPDKATADARTARELMALGKDISDTERTKRTQALIPGISQKACANYAPPAWPHQFITTGILTPVQFKWTPLPTILFYDWKKAGTLFGYLYEARTQPPTLEIVSVLRHQIGYSVERLPNRVFACGAKGPGVVRPDWMASAGCDCKAVIANNPQFGPEEVSAIRACPIKNLGLYPMWSWYTAAGRPILFTEPRANSTGLHLADYYRWLPGVTMPQDAFALPKQCTYEGAQAKLPVAGNGLAAEGAASCVACHVSRQ